MPNLYIIRGCNGAGKTTASMTLLPEILNCLEFVNADNIAKGLSPFRPEKVAFEAGRIMLNRIDELMAAKVDFAFETTLATRSYRGGILKAKNMGYEVTLIFLWLPSPELATERVAKRVAEGGHGIPKEILLRRYHRGISNLVEIYASICDVSMINDNSMEKLTVAEMVCGAEWIIHDIEKWNLFQTVYNEN